MCPSDDDDATPVDALLLGPPEGRMGKLSAQQTLRGGRLQDAWREQFGNGSVLFEGTSPEDGLPAVVGDDRPGDVGLPLTEETMVCLADERAFVEVFAEEMGIEVGMKYAHLAGKGIRKEKFSGNLPAELPTPRSRWTKDGRDQLRATFKPEEVEERWGLMWAVAGGKLHRLVRPVRPVCKHFKARIALDQKIVSGETPAQPHFLYCTAGPTTDGAMLDLQDENILACAFRDPPCPGSDRQLRDRLVRKMEQGRGRTFLPVIKPVDEKAAPREQVLSPAELAKEAGEAWGEQTHAVHLARGLWALPPSLLLEGVSTATTDVVVVGASWLPRAHHFGVGQAGPTFEGEGRQLHYLRTTPRHYEAGVPFGEVDALLAAQLEKLPELLRAKLSAGATVVVTGADVAGVLGLLTLLLDDPALIPEGLLALGPVPAAWAAIRSPAPTANDTKETPL